MLAQNFLLILLIHVVCGLQGPEPSCAQRRKILGIEKSSKFTLTDVEVGQELRLACHYCHESGDKMSKVWYRQDRFFLGPATELIPDMHDDEKDNRIFVKPDHTLVIKEFRLTDTGNYYCHGSNDMGTRPKFQYLVDVTMNSSSVESGDLVDWEIYEDKYIEPINKRLRMSKKKTYLRIRQSGVKLRVLTEWQDWGPCHVCNRKKGIQKRRGPCRVRDLKPQEAAEKEAEMVFWSRKKKNKKQSKNEVFAFEFSCRSESLSRLFPFLSLDLILIPDFVTHRSCDGTCEEKKENRFRIRLFKRKKQRKTIKQPKVRHRMFRKMQNDGIALSCPGAKVDDEVVWKNNNWLIMADSIWKDSGRTVMIDDMNTLHIFDLQPYHASNYTCYLNSFLAAAFWLIVRSNDALLSSAVLAHNLTLLGVGFLFAFLLYLFACCVMIKEHIVQRRNSLRLKALRKQHSKYKDTGKKGKKKKKTNPFEVDSDLRLRGLLTEEEYKIFKEAEENKEKEEADPDSSPA